ncbi:dipeptidyl aminopeptidase/acylaminoacyl peptidase [Rhizobium sp. PP-F2F-G38]|nr:dipeptidyl aminopeptidase/acylaminoacyl peptidase [Rhizobium sp. PP-F2F-G38]
MTNMLRNRRGTQRNVQRTGSAGLLTACELFANPRSLWGFEPSFDGRLLAWWGVTYGRVTVFVGRLSAAGKLKVIAALNGQNEHFTWLPYESQLHILSGQRLWLVDPFKPGRENWADVTPRGFQSWNIVSEASDSAGRTLVVSADRDPALLDLYSVRADGGGKELVSRNEGNTRAWLMSRNGQPVVRIDRSTDGGSVFLTKDDTQANWREFVRTDPDDFLTVWPTDDPDLPMEGLSNRDRDKVALVSIDSGTGEETVLLDSASVDILDIFQFSRGSRSDLAIVRDGYPEYVGLTERGKRFVELVGSQNGPVHVELSGFSRDGRFVSVAVSDEGRPLQFQLFDLLNGSIHRIARSPLDRRGKRFCRNEPVQFTSRDGRVIPAFLTLPNGASKDPGPAIVHVHGGPAERDIWAYDLEKQFLGSRGYAVLSINYRGSIGYGRKFQAAGYGEYGRAMQDDVADAARWLVAANIADEGRIGVMGGSYGGYAAALAMARDVGVFKAAVVDYGLLDVKYQMQNNPFAWGLYLGQMMRYFGDPAREEDLEMMVERSPLTHVLAVRDPILLTAGKMDHTVGFEQTEEFERALRGAGKSVEAVYFAREGHGYVRWQTKVLRAHAIERFFASTLGGKKQHFSFAALLAELWR